jgi:hypothetical protein
MRHSSWTLFLVPLALLLVLLLPGATKNADPKDPVIGARYEQILGDGIFALEPSPPSPITLEEAPGERSEALFKD